MAMEVVMFAPVLTRSLFRYPAKVLLLLALSATANAQSTASIEGQIIDQDGAVIPKVEVKAISRSIAVERATLSDDAGRYQITALPVGEYQLEIKASGFQTQLLESIRVEVGRRITQDFQLQVGEASEQVTVYPTDGFIEHTSVSVGHVIDRRVVQEAPLNGRYFVDLGLLAPGSVTPPQNGFSTVPIRGSGSFAINTAGNREDTVNFLINGITLNNPWFSSLAFQPSISSIQEFKIDNSTLSAENGQNSGAVVNIATRSGSNQFHGELFEFFRNDMLDARNFFNFTQSEPPPFKRNQFGGSVGGPILTDKTFFYFSFEGVRHRQGLNLNSLVLSDVERASVTDPVITRLLPLIPRANFVDSSGTSRFVGSATAPVNIDNWTIDVVHNLSANNRLHGFYLIQQRDFIEPSRFGNTIPGFGNMHRSFRQLFTFNMTHTFSSSVINELRFGFNRISARDESVAKLNPAEFGIVNGVTKPIGLSQINVAGGSLNFGGPSVVPVARGDTVFTVADTLYYLNGRHSLKFGGEFRQFLNNLNRSSPGTFNFPTVADFIGGTANSFNITLGDQSSSVTQRALGFFAQDHFKVNQNLTFELGLRYEWNITPTERFDRFIVFDAQTSSLLRVGTHIDEIYKQNNKNFQPRVGFAWDPFRSGKTVLRGGYAILVDQPLTSVVAGRGANPPLAVPLTFTGPVRFENAITRAQAAGLSPLTVDHDFTNAYLQSWNLNLQRELTPVLGIMVGYFGSKGSHLTIRRNLNQPVNGVRPFPALSPSSPILPGTPLGNITQTESTGNSSYNALWASAQQRLARGLQFNAAYTFSKSLDYNSLSLQGIVVQDSFNLRGDRGLSDFDARHRLVVSAIYDLPFSGSQFVEGWQLAAIVQSQSGNPVNIVTSSTLNGVANTVRPNVTGPIRIIGSVDQWFDPGAFAIASGFGSLGRNVVIGPEFNNTDFSIIKNTRLSEALRVQFRAEFFDLFNHPNFGQPGNVLGTPAFGRITNTRFPTGESGSSRQIQFALKLIF
jgi:hypothetical protein